LLKLPLVSKQTELSDRAKVINFRPEFPRDEVLRLMGGGPDSKGTRATNGKVEKWIRQLRSSVSPRIVFSVRAVRSVDPNGIQLSDGMYLRSVKLSRAMRSSEHLVCFVGTLGREIDEQVSRVTERGRISETYVVDALGSACVENTVERFHDAMDEQAREMGLGTTVRFSPGYCDWSLREQIKLFRMVDSKAIGVSLSPSALMSPRKSVSGVFGFAADESTARVRSNPCLLCEKRDCFSRRVSSRNRH
jgi:Vitamin B12 dependent methionine synthase, activation domain